MELTDELKEKLLKCETREQADELLNEAGLLLSDNALDGIAGGLRPRYDPGAPTAVQQDIDDIRKKHGLPPLYDTRDPFIAFLGTFS